MVETTADLVAVGEVIGTKVDSRRVSDGLRADMLSSAVAPVFNSFPATAFAQNVGLVALSGIKSRYAVALGGGVLVLLGLSPWLAAVVGMVPLPVLGGAGIVLFGSVAASGVRTLSKVNYANNQNMVVVAVALAFGLIPVVAPAFYSHFPSWFETIFHSGISAASIMAVLLNLFFNVFRPSVPEGPSYVAAAPPVLVREGEPHTEH
jgi:xanthine/uracil permease